MAYYDKLLRSMMELIQGTVRIMEVDGMSEAIENLGKALLVIEDAWATVSWEWTASLAARVQMETEGGRDDREGGRWLDQPARLQMHPRMCVWST
jgi:hypothetical protein